MSGPRAGLALALAACARAGSGPAEPHVLRIADNVDPSSLNPLLAHDQDTIGYDLLVTQTLVGLSADNKLVPVLVTRDSTHSERRHFARRQDDRLSFAPRRSIRRRKRADVGGRRVHVSRDRRSAQPGGIGGCIPARGVAADARPLHRDRAVETAMECRGCGALRPGRFRVRHSARPCVCVHRRHQSRVEPAPFGTGPFRVAHGSAQAASCSSPIRIFGRARGCAAIIFVLIPTTQSSLLALRARDVDITEDQLPLKFPTLARRHARRVVITPMNGAYFLLSERSLRPPTTCTFAVRSPPRSTSAKSCADVSAH